MIISYYSSGTGSITDLQVHQLGVEHLLVELSYHGFMVFEAAFAFAEVAFQALNHLPLGLGYCFLPGLRLYFQVVLGRYLDQGVDAALEQHVLVFLPQPSQFLMNLALFFLKSFFQFFSISVDKIATGSFVLFIFF